MKFVYPAIECVFEFGVGFANELVIENKKLLCEILNDVAVQSQGLCGSAVLSVSDTPVEFSRYAEVIDRFIPFEINNKTLISHICKALEREAVKDETFAQTSAMLANFEKYLYELCYDIPCEISFPKLSIGSLIKSSSPQIEDNEKSPLEKVLDYMMLVREFDKDKLFITVNLRCFFDDKTVEEFIKTAISHDFKLLLIESTSRKMLDNIKRTIIDEDLCEI